MQVTRKQGSIDFFVHGKHGEECILDAADVFLRATLAVAEKVLPQMAYTGDANKCHKLVRWKMHFASL